MYELHLKECSPSKRDLVYDAKELFAFIDQMPELSALVCVPSLTSQHFTLVSGLLFVLTTVQSLTALKTTRMEWAIAVAIAIAILCVP